MEDLIKKAKDIFGTTDSCSNSTFILPDGKGLKFPQRNVSYNAHADIAEKVIGKMPLATDEFIDLTGVIRYYPQRSSI